MSTPTGAVIDVRDLRMRYGDKDVLTGVDFSIHSGEVVCLLGPNGAGKTTTIEILEGFRERSAGAVEVLGEDPARASEGWRARTGVVLQSWRDHARWTPRSLLDQVANLAYSTADRQRPVPTDELLDVVGLVDLADQKIATFSGGQRRRLDVAMGIVGEPSCCSSTKARGELKPQSVDKQVVHRLADLEHTTILLTHDLDEAEKLADRVLILAGGRIVADDTAERLALRAALEVEVKWSRGGERFVHSTKGEPGRRTSCVGCSTSRASRWSTSRSAAPASRTPTSTWCNDTRPAGPTRPSASSGRWSDVRDLGGPAALQAVRLGLHRGSTSCELTARRPFVTLRMRNGCCLRARHRQQPRVCACVTCKHHQVAEPAW